MDYDIGLDIGTGSVGFAGIDENSRLIHKKSKNVIGVRLFGSANKAEERRGFRTTRRRLKRRKWRLGLLNEIFGPHLMEIDENFLGRLKESNLVASDKSQDGIVSYLYGNQSDAEFHQQYPTIYHLRQALMTEHRQFDLREVYLAVHHLIKYRGNFLNNAPASQFKTGDLKLPENFRRLNQLYAELMPENVFELQMSQLSSIKALLLDETQTKNDRQKQLVKEFYVHADKANKEFESERKNIASNILKAILGLKAKFDVVTNISLDKETAKDWNFSLADADIEGKTNMLLENLDDVQAEIFTIISDLHNARLLAAMLSDGHGGLYTTISEAKVDSYQQHHQQLQWLKEVARQHPDRKKANKLREAYALYVGSLGDKKTGQDDFAKTVKANLDDSAVAKKILAQIELGDFMPKQRTRNNGVFPHQLQQRELDEIIENQKEFYPWLAELNPNPKRASEAKYKLDELIAFRIPYYVGPLVTPEDQKKGSQAGFAWMVRKEAGAITPWNFEQKVDKKESANRFIRRMTATDKFLIGEPVLPANSLLYQRFIVLNELNMIRINDLRITLQQKQSIFEQLFKKHKRVTTKMLRQFLRASGDYRADTELKIDGLSDPQKFNTQLTSYVDLRAIFGDRIDDPNLQANFEQFIEWSTVFEDGSIYQDKLAEVKWLTPEERAALARLHYTGWGQVSEKLLTKIANDHGERIIDELWNTNQNFQQIRTQDDIVKAIQKINDAGFQDDSADGRIDALRTSPENKRAIRQVLAVVDDIQNVMEKAPRRLFVEFARDPENLNHKRTISRGNQIREFYQNIADEIAIDATLQKQVAQAPDQLSDKYYLYFTQLGKDIYTGEPINLDEIDKYEIDHIIPRSFVWDNSLDNRVLTLAQINKEKRDRLPQKLYGEARKNDWQLLHRLQLISNRKFRNLTFNDDRLTKYGVQGFINRQLVDTRQVIKYAVEILANEYPDTEIVSIKASLSHQLRLNYHLYKNREVNDYHHGFDAFLSGFIGQYLLKQYPKLRGYLVYGDFAKKISDDFKPQNLLHGLFKQFPADEKLRDKVEPIDRGQQDVDLIDYLMHVYFFKQMLVSKAVVIKRGALFNQTVYKASYDPSYGKKGSKKLIPIKQNRPTNLYGGYTNVFEACMTLIKVTTKKGDVYQLKGIPGLFLSELERLSGQKRLLRLKEILVQLDSKHLDGAKFEILVPLLRMNQLIVDGKTKFTMGSSTIKHNAQQLVLGWKALDVLRKTPSRLTKDDDQRLVDVYDEIISQVERYFPLYQNVLEKLLDGRQKFEQLPVTAVFEKGKLIQIGKRQAIESMLRGLHADAGKPFLKELGLKSPFGGFQDKTGNGYKLSANAQIVYQSPTGLLERRVCVKDI